jgi:hypothetical protein
MRSTALGLMMAASAFLALAGAAQAEPAAIVEAVSNPTTGLRVEDALNVGQMIMLGEGGRLVVTYLRSCTRETITGGVVSVGTESSIVAGGEVQRERVECDGGRQLLAADQARKSAVVTYRQIPLSARIVAADPAR